MISVNTNITLVLSLFVFQISIFTQGTWERLNSPTDKNLNSVFFVDNSYGWAVGDSGVIIHTSNSGTEWIIQDSKTLNDIRDIYFLNQEIGWAVYWEVYNFPFGTYILKTTDGGVNWIRSQQPEEDIFSQCILFLDSLNGWMGGKGTPFVKLPIVKTSDGGRTWMNAEIDSSDFSDLPVYDIQFFDSSFGYASGGAIDCCGIMWWTNNGGNFWYVIDTPAVARDPVNQLHLIDSIHVLGVGGDFETLGYGVEMIRTSDGGLNWDFEHVGITGAAWDIDFRTSEEAWAPLGGEEKLIFSLDSGITWQSIPTPDSTSIFKITFPDSLHGFGVGNKGAIIKYRSDSTSHIIVEDKLFAKRFELDQNYPNPFNPITTLSFIIGQLSFVSLKIFDVLGNEVATLVDGYKPAGSYEVEWNASSYPSGVYLYQLRAGSYIETKKMILSK